MSTGMIIPIVFFAVAIILILVALGWVLVNKRTHHRHVNAEKMRDQAKEEALQVNRREALAEESAAKARAAQADSDVKAAQASGLEEQAAAHRSEAKPPAIDSTSSGTAPTRWIRPRGHPKRRSRPTANS
jgi:regulatory protein YycI of two-component signal transduction system YycFG